MSISLNLCASFISSCYWPLYGNINEQNSLSQMCSQISALLFVCLSDWVLFNRPDLKTTCWTSQGRRITCWKSDILASGVYTCTHRQMHNIGMHLHICLHESCLHRFFLHARLPVTIRPLRFYFYIKWSLMVVHLLLE